MRASFACASATPARATSSCERALSRLLRLTKLRENRSWLRRKFDSARVRLARACCSSARCTAASNSISTSPRRTDSPSRKRIASIRPDTSGRSTTDSFDTSEPTALTSSASARVPTVCVSTTTGPDCAPPAPPGTAFAPAVPAAAGPPCAPAGCIPPGSTAGGRLAYQA